MVKKDEQRGEFWTQVIVTFNLYRDGADQEESSQMSEVQLAAHDCGLEIAKYYNSRSQQDGRLLSLSLSRSSP